MSARAAYFHNKEQTIILDKYLRKAPQLLLPSAENTAGIKEEKKAKGKLLNV